MRPSLQFTLNQKLAITPQLQQAIRLLQLSAVELEAEIRATVESNPLLEQIEPEEETMISPNLPIGAEMDYSIISTFQEEWSRSSDKKPDLSLQRPSETTLHQYLLGQMELAHFSEQERAIATALIDAISEEGYLLSSIADIQETLGFSTQEADINAVLSQIQQFEPTGIGARDLAECLNLQLNLLPTNTPWLTETQLLVKHHLEAVGKKEYARLKKDLDLTDNELHAAIKLLTSLNPRPGAVINPKKSEYVIPDILAWKKGEQIFVELKQNFVPKIRINAHYASGLSLPNHAHPLMVKEQLKEAKSFIKGLQTRNETLLSVARCILEQQKEFFDNGEEAMLPLNLRAVATKLGLHESTISRITSQKYILTPKGLYELKYFFSSSIPSILGAEASSIAIRAYIRKLIAEESNTAPLSDNKIMKVLLGRGIHIARRTVTKYREAMRISSSTERKFKF